MQYDPYQGRFAEQTAFPQLRTHHRDVQRLTNTGTPQPNRQQIAAAQRQAEIEERARQQPLANARRNRVTRSPASARRRAYSPTNRAYRDDKEDIDGEYDDVWPPQVVTRSAIRYNLPPEGVYQTGNKRFHVEYQYGDVPPRTSARTRQPSAPQQQTYYTDEIDERETERPPKRRRQGLHLHWLAILGLGGVIMLALWLFGQMVVSAWQLHQDDATYGRPRTFQIDQVVGHNDSTENPSHFEAINLNRHIIVIELPGGDSSKARIYNITTLFGNGQELTPVTISFKDVNNDGLLDMEIHIQDQTIVFINENGQFRPLKPTEHIHL